jgi:hypothetical protein
LRVLQSVDGLDVVDLEDEGEDQWVNVEAMDTTDEGHVEGQTGGPPQRVHRQSIMFIMLITSCHVHYSDMI